jgi:Transposase
VVSARFHFIQYAVAACDQIRKIESRADDGTRKQLQRPRWLWVKNRVNWTQKDPLWCVSIALERCLIGMTCEMTMELQGIHLCKNAGYGSKDAGVVMELFGNSAARVQAMREQTGKLLTPMGRVARVIEGHLWGLLARSPQGLATALIKGVMSLRSAVKRKARRYQTVECKARRYRTVKCMATVSHFFVRNPPYRHPHPRKATMNL